MRRKDREVEGIGNITGVLERCDVVRIALYDGERPYIVPMNFGLLVEGEKITLFIHSAKEGRKIDLIKKNANICFEADRLIGIDEGQAACDYTSRYESVVGEGVVKMLEDRNDKAAGLDVIMKKYGYDKKGDYPQQMLDSVAVLKIDIKNITGKANY